MPNPKRAKYGPASKADNSTANVLAIPFQDCAENSAQMITTRTDFLRKRTVSACRHRYVLYIEEAPRPWL